MAGFPIVSLGAITWDGNIEQEQLYYNSAKMVVPQFACDEYYNSDDTLIEKAYREHYKNASDNNKIVSFTVEPNNIDVSNGEMSLLNYSIGFDLYGTWANFYGNSNKLKKIESYRVDSFYIINIKNFFFYGTKKKGTENLYFNAPHLLIAENGFSLAIARNVEHVYLNIPKLEKIEKEFLSRERQIQNIHFNASSLTSIGDNVMFLYYSEMNINISGTQQTDIQNIFNLLNEHIPNEEGMGGKPYVTLILSLETENLMDFDLRYWSKYENETGLDIGLLEGSNLR